MASGQLTTLICALAVNSVGPAFSIGSSFWTLRPKKVLFDIIYNARLIGAKEACSLYLANEALPRDKVLPRAIETVERANSGNPDILMLGRDLYHAMRGLSPIEAIDKSRFALGAALGARDERPPKQK